LVAPRIEPEVVLKLKDRIARDSADSDTLADAVEWVAIGFEIVDCHYPAWQFTAAEIVADFGAHSRLIVGEPTMIDERLRAGLANLLENLGVKLRCDSAMVDTGFGRNALGGPINALGFLIATLESHSWADEVQRGEVITTGTLTGIPYIHAGERWTVDVSGIELAPLSIALV
jgi:2-keto-4-pentenoate hydratase